MFVLVWQGSCGYDVIEVKGCGDSYDLIFSSGMLGFGAFVLSGVTCLLFYFLCVEIYKSITSYLAS